MPDKKMSKKIYKYETHLHTSPVSACANASVQDTLEFYKALDYDGVFITNHFVSEMSGLYFDMPDYKSKLDFYFSDYDSAVTIGKKLGIKVFLGAEISYKGTDFLIYGLNKEWYYNHPEIMDMKMTDKLELMKKDGAFIIHAHPFHEARYINHIRLFPANVHAVEVLNTSKLDGPNEMAKLYADHYNLICFAGSDNHSGSKRERDLGGMWCFEEATDDHDFINKAKEGKLRTFSKDISQETRIIKEKAGESGENEQ